MNSDKDRLIDLMHKQFAELYKDGDWSFNEMLVGVAEHLLANGIIVPPCRVGDYVWLVFTPKYPANPNDYGKWFMTQYGVQRIIFGAKGLSIETWNMGTIPAKELGKTVFLTKEEAEAKLKELKENARNIV